ncbi:hypothetical protein DICVIV_00131 [Dictyocaulus viviparus]|uniref:Uncharacterized protein n=1 Tax=Dictyocaulus viviparus TaxID=29172 RepID=A0A0D8YBY9_DICVI|nr:hypothetical protein DICVIV_00131 [Dictyocaulus viviparus]
MLFRACGSAMSNVPSSSRKQILARLWKEVNEKEIPTSIASVNALLSSLLENGCHFESFEALSDIEEKRKLLPQQQTFQLLLTSLARSGNVEGCRAMVYEMNKRSASIDSVCNDALVYCFALRGYYAKADSLVKQALDKYGPEAVVSSQGACAKAAAFRADLNRLRKVLRRAVSTERKLILSVSDILETIWLLAEMSSNGDGAECVNLTEQMLNHTCHEPGFFRLLIREVERHISHQHYYTAVALLEDTNKISDCLNYQRKSLFLNQMVAQLSRQMIRNEVNVVKVNDIANRVVAIFHHQPNTPRIHDDLLFAAIMYKGFSIDKRMEYISALVDMQFAFTPYLIICSANDIEDRLKLIFRCCNLGYTDLSEHDISVLSRLVLKPLYDKQMMYTRGNMSKLDKIARIIRSFGIKTDSLWQTMYAWWHERTSCEKKLKDPGLAERPFAKELQEWLRQHYAVTFERDRKSSVKGPPIQITYDKLKKYVNDRDSSKVHAFVSSYGWPEDTNFEEIIPDLLALYLDHEDWINVKKLLISLSAQAGRWHKKDDPMFSPIKNYNLLQILRRLSNEGEKISLTIANYDTFFNTLHEYNKLFGRCFERLPKLSVEEIDECIDLLRTLTKLEILQLHSNETLTSVFIGIILKRHGWEEAINTWMKFQSGLNCSNGMVALLRYCLMQKTDNFKRNMQYVLHKAQNFLSQSRVHCLYAAVLVTYKHLEEAVAYLEEHKLEIDPIDCMMAMRFMNAFKTKVVDEEFIRQFMELCLKHTRLSSDTEVVRQMQADWMRTCEQRKLAPLALRLYELFKQYGIDLQNDDKLRLWGIVGEHEVLAKRWIYEPDGFLQINADDEIIQNTDIERIKKYYKFRLLKRNHLCGSTRAKYDQGPAILVDNSPYESVGDRDPNHVSHWLGNNNQLGTSRSTRLSYYTLDQLKSLGSFGLLSTWDVDSDCTGIGDTTSIDDNSNNGDSPKIDLSFIPTTADLLELGGLMDYCDVEQQDGLLHQRFYRPRVLNDGITLSVKNDLTLLGHDLEPSSSSHHSRPKFAHISKSHTRKCERSKNEILGDPPSSSPSRTRCNMRFDPDDNRTCRASIEEIVTAVRNQDLSSLRSILTEKRWPDCRSIGAHLDHLFELIIRDCHDVDEALLFFQDFAVCNRRGFLHDLNGIRLACRVARETGSLSATMEILRVFRNMFLVRSPKAMCSIPEKILEEFYGILCSVGSKSDMRKLHESMISHAFVDNSDIFVRVYTEILLQKDDFVSVFDEWKRLSSRYGTTCASDLMWKGIFISVSDITKRAKLTDELLAHCNQYEHPAAIIANLILVLTQLNQIDAARTIFLKVSVPGRFFKKPVLRIARSEDALRIIENFASLVTECMFAEKRRPECSGAYEQTSSFLSVELLSKLNRFYGMGRSKLKKSNRKSEKLKLYCINEEQLIELTEFIQLIWMQKAEVNNDNGAIDRLISWSTTNRVEIPPKIKQRIDLLRSNS